VNTPISKSKSQSRALFCTGGYMPETKEDVNTAESSTEEQVVNTETATTEEATTTETAEQTQEESKPQSVSPVDERGVPWMNRYHEEKRKSEELLNNLETRMGEILSKQTTQQQPEYTISELETFAIANPNQRPWVEEQKARIIEKNVAKIAQTEIKGAEEKRTAEQKKVNTYNYVAQAYPEIFTSDNFGNKNFNNQHPMVQQMGNIMNDPRFKNDPEGLIAAADIAYGRMARMQSGQTQKKVKILQQNLKKVQKGTLIEGSGQQETKSTKDELAKAKERLKGKLNDKTAAFDAVKAYLKKTGTITEE
jgi:hypothetical protein